MLQGVEEDGEGFGREGQVARVGVLVSRMEVRVSMDEVADRSASSDTSLTLRKHVRKASRNSIASCFCFR
jgi:hypothetical protein